MRYELFCREFYNEKKQLQMEMLYIRVTIKRL